MRPLSRASPIIPSEHTHPGTIRSGRRAQPPCLSPTPLDAGHPPLALMAMLQSRKRRRADEQPRESHPNKTAKGEGRTQSPSNPPPSSGTICPRSGSLVARCENSTGGTTLRLPHSLRHPRCTQRILTGSQGVEGQILAIFEAYGRTQPWVKHCLPVAPSTLADEQSPQRQRRHPPRPNGRRHTTTILSNI